MQGVSSVVALRKVVVAAGFLYDKAVMFGDTIIGTSVYRSSSQPNLQSLLPY
jgi:hypothetical protein